MTHALGTFAVPMLIAVVSVSLGHPTSDPMPLKSESDRVQFFERGVVTVVEGVAKRWLAVE